MNVSTINILTAALELLAAHGYTEAVNEQLRGRTKAAARLQRKSAALLAIAEKLQAIAAKPAGEEPTA